MATSWIEVITMATMPIIDDVRWQEELAISPAVFFRSKSVMMPLAVAMLNHPLELYQSLVTNMVEPVVDELTWTSTAASMTGETTLNTGKTGFDLASCVLRSIDKFGDTVLTPYDISYDAETGDITFQQQEEEGLEYDIDFYKDGSFAFDLSPVQKRLVGLALACVWDERFSRNWLNIQMKLKDSTFNTVNESNYMQTVQNRLVQNQRFLYDEMRAYEQSCAYAEIAMRTYPPRQLI